MGNDKSLDDKIMAFLSSDPDKAIETFEKHGVDFNGLKELKMGKLFAQKRFNITDDQFEAVEFVFWITYFMEREINDIISFVEKNKMFGIENPMINGMLDKLPFGSKISLIEKHYATMPKDKNYITMLWKINDLRNHVAHGRFDELKYGGYMLNDPKGQIKLTIEIMNSSLSKK